MLQTPLCYTTPCPYYPLVATCTVTPGSCLSSQYQSCAKLTIQPGNLLAGTYKGISVIGSGRGLKRTSPPVGFTLTTPAAGGTTQP